MELIAVVLKAPTSTQRFESAKALLNYGFASYTLVEAVPEQVLPPIPVTLGREAFVQPVLDRGTEQREPSPLGLRREDRFLYLGAPDRPLAPADWVEWNGAAYTVQSAHPVYLGRTALYTWAVLRPRDLEQEETV